MRVTTHNSRRGLAKHNDRQFDLSHADHIDPTRTANNITWTIYGDGATFDDIERRYYREQFGAHLAAQAERYAATGHPERAKTVDDYLQAPRTCPEEELLYIGDKDNHAPADTLRAVVADYLAWRAQAYPQVVTLDWALHTDESGAPHVHVRSVWIGHDRDGAACVSQSKALADMGIQAPHPDKRTSRNNNPKQTYTADCRAHFVSLCQARGLDITTKPRAASLAGRDLADYQAKQAQAKLQDCIDIQGIIDAAQPTPHRAIGGRVVLAKDDYDRLAKAATVGADLLQQRDTIIGARQDAQADACDIVDRARAQAAAILRDAKGRADNVARACDRANADIAARFRAELDSLFSHDYGTDTDPMDTPAALDEPDPPAPEPVTTPQDAGDLGLFPAPDDDRDQPDLGDDDWDDLL